MSSERRWSITCELAIPVAERLAAMADDLDVPLRHVGVDARWVAPERVRLLLGSGPLGADGAGSDSADEEAVRHALSGLASSFGPLTFGLRALALRPEGEPPRLLVGLVDPGAEDVVARRQWLREQLRPGLLDPATGDGAAPEEAGESGPVEAWVLVGRLWSKERPDLAGMGSEPVTLGTTRCREVGLVVHEATRTGPRWRTLVRRPWSMPAA